MEKRDSMAGSGKPTTGTDQSLGDLVALATKDISQLVRYEIDLAKSELRGDIRRVAISGALFGVAAFFGVGILVALFFAYTYLLYEVAKAPGGLAAAFGYTAVTVLVLGAICGFVAYRVIRRMSGMKRTRESVTEGIGMLRREGKDTKDTKDTKDSAALSAGDKPAVSLPGPASAEKDDRASVDTRSPR